MKSRRILLVLSGGGAKATAHLGAMRALIERNLEPTHIIGTSMGAVIGAGLAAGMTPEEMLQRMEGVERRDIAAIDPIAVVKGLFAHAWFREGPFRETLGRMLPVHTFAELRLPLTVTATDLDSGDLVCFGTGGEDAPLVDALYASCALPLLYPPGVIGGRRLADGGLRGPLALEVAKRFPADLVVAIDVGPGFDAEDVPPSLPPPPLVRLHNDADGILMADNTRLQLALWRATPGLPRLIYVRPRVRRGATFAIEQFAHYFQEGYRATKDTVI